MEITLACIFYLPTAYYRFFADRTADPFDRKSGKIRYMPPPCLTSCSFYTGKYDKLFPAIIRGGVCAVIMDLFSGENRISGTITFYPMLIESIIKYKGCNRLVFGVKSDKKFAPIEVKKLVMILVSAGILGHSTVVETSEE